MPGTHPFMTRLFVFVKLEKETRVTPTRLYCLRKLPKKKKKPFGHRYCTRKAEWKIEERVLRKTLYV